VIAEGAFVHLFFPTSQMPSEPGLLRICYCLAARHPLALIAYTTSQPWPRGTPLPFGVRIFTREEAAALGQQRAFRLHLNRQARVPLTTQWFPNLDTANQGVIAMAPARLRQELYEIAIELDKRYRLNVERLGL
jgi:hypothetical protein